MEGEDFFLKPISGINHIPVEDLILQTELRVAAARRYEPYLFPFRTCHSGHRYHMHSIEQHLRKYIRDYYLNHLMVGGNPPKGFLVEEVVHGWNERHHARSENLVDRIVRSLDASNV
jgi:hypothetical protein